MAVNAASNAQVDIKATRARAIRCTQSFMSGSQAAEKYKRTMGGIFPNLMKKWLL